LLILIFFIYFGLPLLVPGADLPGFLTGAIALTAFATAYIAEIFRGSIEAIPKGQSEAADALGLSYSRKFRYVILPQAVKIAVAPGITFLIGLVKDSSLISVIAFMELTRAGNIVSNLTYDPITTYLVVAAIYFIICYGISLLGRKYEKSLGVQIDPLNVVPPLSLQIGQSR
jgi:polar amino acid transport system permease protein